MSLPFLLKTWRAGMALLLVAGCQKGPDNHPAPEEAITTHVKAVFGLLDQHMDDCPRALKEASDYLAAHRDEIDRLVRRSAEIERGSSESKRKSRKASNRQRAQEMLKDHMETMMQFAKRCPEQTTELGSELAFLKKVK